MSGNQRSLLQAFKLIDSMAEKIELPQKIKSRGQEIFKDMEENKAIRGRNTEALAAACLYAACRLEGVPRTFKEICALTNVSKKDIGRAYKFVQKLLNLQVELIQHSDYMNRFCSHLKLSKKIQNYAESVAKKATEMGFVSGRSPITVAASAIFMVSQLTSEKRSQKEIADITGVSEPTIRNCCKDMEAVRDRLLPRELLGSQSTEAKS
jgi:transcription initiation factor TFIIB